MEASEAAEESADAAANSAVAASEKAEAAADSAAAASASASAASESASDITEALIKAEGSANAASQSALEAATSANKASTSAGEAASSASAAEEFATLAGENASTAVFSANTAEQKAEEAASSASTASEKASSAAMSADAAEYSADTAAQKASEAAEIAQEASDSAQQAATIISQSADGVTLMLEEGTLRVKDVAIGGDESDLASARGLLGFLPRLADTVDLDDVTNHGMYVIRGSTATNTPNAAIACLCVYNLSNSMVCQLWCSGSTQELFYRTRVEGSWSDWVGIFPKTGGILLGDLDLWNHYIIKRFTLEFGTLPSSTQWVNGITFQDKNGGTSANTRYSDLRAAVNTDGDSVMEIGPYSPSGGTNARIQMWARKDGTADMALTFDPDASSDNRQIATTAWVRNRIDEAHPDSGVSAGSYGPTAATTLAFGGSVNIPQVTVDAKGIVTSVVNRAIKLPAAPTSVSGNAGTATKLATARTIDGVDFNGSAAITHYGSCSTAAATAAKTVAITGFKLVTGAVAFVYVSR